MFSKSQSPPSPRKLPPTHSESSMSARLGITAKDIAYANIKQTVTTQRSYDGKDNVDKKSSNSPHFELGPPTEYYIGAVKVRVD